MKTFIFSMISAVVLFGCSGPTENEMTYGTIEVTVTNSLTTEQITALSPNNTESIILTVTEVSVKKAGQEEWQIISESETEVDFFELANNLFLQLGEVKLETGRYNQLRIMIAESNEIIIDGISFILVVPSGVETGLKINLNFEIIENQETEVIVDLRAQAVVWTNPDYILQPAFNASVDE